MSACAPRPGISGRCARSGSSSSTTLTARSKSAVSSPGIEPDAGGADHAETPVREVEEIVHEPTTRVPSYTTAA